MAQKHKFEVFFGPQSKEFTNDSVTVASGSLTTVLEMNVRGTERMVCFIENAGSNAFQGFEIQYSVDQTYYETIYSTSGHFTTLTGDLWQTNGNLKILAAGSTGYFQLITRGKLWVRIQANGNGATTVNAKAVAN
jgi:hypothetical protein